MDEAKAEAFKIPTTWIDRIFARLTDIYGERFTSQFSKPEYMELAKLQWRAGLYGLDGDQIKRVINMCLNNEIKDVPNVVEFFHYGKGWKAPVQKHEIPQASKEVASRYMDEIRGKLHGRSNRNSYATLSGERK